MEEYCEKGKIKIWRYQKVRCSSESSLTAVGAKRSPWRASGTGLLTMFLFYSLSSCSALLAKTTSKHLILILDFMTWTLSVLSKLSQETFFLLV